MDVSVGRTVRGGFHGLDQVFLISVKETESRWGRPNLCEGDRISVSYTFNVTFKLLMWHLKRTYFFHPYFFLIECLKIIY